MWRILLLLLVAVSVVLILPGVREAAFQEEKATEPAQSREGESSHLSSEASRVGDDLKERHLFDGAAQRENRSGSPEHGSIVFRLGFGPELRGGEEVSATVVLSLLVQEIDSKKLIRTLTASPSRPVVEFYDLPSGQYIVEVDWSAQCQVQPISIEVEIGLGQEFDLGAIGGVDSGTYVRVSLLGSSGEEVSGRAMFSKIGEYLSFGLTFVPVDMDGVGAISTRIPVGSTVWVPAPSGGTYDATLAMQPTTEDVSVKLESVLAVNDSYEAEVQLPSLQVLQFSLPLREGFFQPTIRLVGMGEKRGAAVVAWAVYSIGDGILRQTGETLVEHGSSARVTPVLEAGEYVLLGIARGTREAHSSGYCLLNFQVNGSAELYEAALLPGAELVGDSANSKDGEFLRFNIVRLGQERIDPASSIVSLPISQGQFSVMGIPKNCVLREERTGKTIVIDEELAPIELDF